MNFPPTRTPQRTPGVIALTLWCYRRLLMLHPPMFRREYGAAIVQVFRATCDVAYHQRGTLGVICLWEAACGDVIRGAVAEYATLLFPSMKGSIPMQIYRRSASALFGAYIAFVLAGIGFAKMSEEVMKSSLPMAHPFLAIAYIAVEVGAVLSLLAILVGGLPVALAALRFGWANGRRDILARFVVPPVALLALIGTIWAFTGGHIGGNTEAAPGRYLAFGVLVSIFLAGAVASTMAVLGAIARSDIGEPVLRFTFVPGILATVAMGAMLVATVGWSIGLWQVAPTRFWGNEGILATSTLLSIVAQSLLMIGAIAIAVRAVAQEVAARRGTSQLA